MSAAASKRWRKRHLEAVKEQKRRYYAHNREALAARRAPGNLRRAQELRRAVLAAFGGVCRCGFSDNRALQIDHINGRGREDRAQFANRDQFLRAVLAAPEKYQLLCANCNWIKRYERGEHSYRADATLLREN